MTANLLAHAGELFACGIARSGAFNRTLTPFGFQAEQRTFWEVWWLGWAGPGSGRGSRVFLVDECGEVGGERSGSPAQQRLPA